MFLTRIFVGFVAMIALAGCSGDPAAYCWDANGCLPYHGRLADPCPTCPRLHRDSFGNPVGYGNGIGGTYGGGGGYHGR
ncbi:lipoprotein [Acidomonas methanolica]|uniref:lipoprotein n=1 Tax=Acidomonas methanolica TaxID=437 RepID=UPI002119B8EE|nr:hypothetical protein [Acidomonas methanolica]MCQ9157246.1 hypothetical protein [Acidomonas methanolica]